MLVIEKNQAVPQNRGSRCELTDYNEQFDIRIKHIGSEVEVSSV